jgi:3-phenylpropionate/trans-cinnamate dioxygenase ferredoxin reductase subunit
MEQSSNVVIAGAGIAAGNAAVALRRHGFAGRVTMIGEEHHPPYQRPPLSKSYLSGETSVESLYTRPVADYDKAKIEFISGTRVESIDRHSRRVLLSDGRRMGYQYLVLALGGRARTLGSIQPGLPESISNLYTIRTVDDVDRLRTRFTQGKKIAILGGGYIGLEVAAVAIQLGLQVCVLERLPRVLARVTAPEVSSFYESIHRRAGVALHTNVEISGLDIDQENNSIAAVRCADGMQVPAELVVAGIGMIPNIELARSAGLQVGDGILVDEHCRSSDREIFAIGDCANHPYTLTGARVRLESVPNALEHARTAAAAICGKVRANTSIPWFWSDQYDLKLQIVGLSTGYERVVIRGSTDERCFAAFYLKGNRIIAADAVNCPQEFGIAKTLISKQIEVDSIQLSDRSNPLTSLLGYAA